MNRLIAKLFISLMFRTQFAIRIRNLELSLGLLSNYVNDTSKVENLFKKLFEVLQIKHPLNNRIIRIGSESDGGYLLVDNFESNQTVISLGVGDNVDAEFELAELGLDIWMYDGTVTRPPRRHNNFKFHPVNVGEVIGGAKSDQNLISLNRIFQQVITDFKSDTSLLKESRNNPPLILLIDIEGSEYDSLLKLNDMYLNYCHQITVEFHNIFSELSNSTLRIIECIKKLNATHEIISVHGNNFGGSISANGFDYPDVIEISWLRKTSDDFEEGLNTFNNPLSRPNNCKLRDLNHLW